MQRKGTAVQGTISGFLTGSLLGAVVLVCASLLGAVPVQQTPTDALRGGQPTPASRPAAPGTQGGVDAGVGAGVTTSARRPQSGPAPTGGFGRVVVDEDVGLITLGGRGAAPSRPQTPTVLRPPQPSGFGDTAQFKVPNLDEPALDGPLPDVLGALDADTAPPSTLALILLDQSGEGLTAEALSTLSIPLTIAIDPAAPNAASRGAMFARAGHAIMAILNVTDVKTGGDVSIALAQALRVLPSATSVFVKDTAGLRRNAPVAQMVFASLAANDLGLVTFDLGLQTQNTAVQATTVFRDLDSKGQSAAIMRRFLDQAIDTAQTEGPLVVMARLRTETINALSNWAEQAGTGTVRVVPVTDAL